LRKRVEKDDLFMTEGDARQNFTTSKQET